MKRLALIAVVFSLIGCSSVTPVSKTSIVNKDGCSVTVYQTKDTAEEHGAIEELCIIEGTSSGSFNHTTETAIKKHAKKACRCGANKVYVQSRAPMGMGVAKVSMVAFKYVSTKDDNKPLSTSTRSKPSYIDELKALATLRDDGIITEDEFQKQKAKILDRE